MTRKYANCPKSPQERQIRPPTVQSVMEMNRPIYCLQLNLLVLFLDYICSPQEILTPKTPTIAGVAEASLFLFHMQLDLVILEVIPIFFHFTRTLELT